MMQKHELKICPRCGAGFECKPGDVLHCQCYGINLSCSAGEEIAGKYADCLCRKCLLEISSEAPQKTNSL